MKTQYPRSEQSKEHDRLRAQQPEVRAKNRAAVKQYRQTTKGKKANNTAAKARNNREMINDFKGTVPCKDCGVIYPPCVMDFDHVRGEKKYNIGYLVSIGTPRMLEDELAKCELVCSNCHRIRTHITRKREGEDGA